MASCLSLEVVYRRHSMTTIAPVSALMPLPSTVQVVTRPALKGLRALHPRGAKFLVNGQVEVPAGGTAVPDQQHQIPQRQEAHRECADANHGDGADRYPVDPARGSGPHGESNPVDCREHDDGRHRSGPDVNGNPGDVRQYRVSDVAMRLTTVAPISRPQKNFTARR
ncbi:MAG: hypothetical protein JWR34_7407 [Mycobacterium sp.]|nr:hypothetical protein [Mycobacterium sp.]